VFVAEPAAIEADLVAQDPGITRSEEVSFADPALAEDPVVAPPFVEQAPAARDDASSEPESKGSTPRSGDRLVIEQFEQAPISLRPTGEHIAVQDQSTISSIEYSDAERVHADESDAGGFEIEHTELTLELPGDTSRLEVESFWSAEPMREADPGSLEAAPGPSESWGENASPANETTEPVETVERLEPEPARDDAAAAYVADPFAVHEPPGLRGAVPDPVAETGAIENTAQESSAHVEPTEVAAPQSSAAAAQELAMLLAQPEGDAEAALEDAFAAPATLERPPRWATPRVVDAIAETPASPQAPTPPPAAAEEDELSDALGWSNGTPNGGDGPLETGAAPVEASHEFSAGITGWGAMPPAPAGEAGLAMSDAIAAALERIAGRVRAGDVPLPGDVALAASDESALAVALAALLRGASRG
jgi:hypothetical protein